MLWCSVWGCYRSCYKQILLNVHSSSTIKSYPQKTIVSVCITAMPAQFVARLTTAAANAPASASLPPSLIVSWCCPCLPADAMPPQCEFAQLDGYSCQDMCAAHHARQRENHSANGFLSQCCHNLLGCPILRAQMGTSTYSTGTAKQYCEDSSHAQLHISRTGMVETVSSTFAGFAGATQWAVIPFDGEVE